jgi:alpha-D-xyloside xylohydrolase
MRIILIPVLLFCASLWAQGNDTVQADPAAKVLDGTVDVNFTNMDGKPDTLRLHNLMVDDKLIDTRRISVRQIGEGVHEIVVQDEKSANWELHIADPSDVYDSNVFGFGERFNALNQRYNIISNSSHDAFGPKGSNSYKPMPFFMSDRGYGVWVDTYATALFDMGLSHRGEFIVRLTDRRLRVVIFEGPRFPLILERFTAQVGRIKLPPYWAFAPWKGRNWYPDMKSVFEDVDRYRELGLPGSVLVIDSPWETNYNTFEFNRQQFSDPVAMVRHIHERGFKLCLWLTPMINSQTLPERDFIGKIPLTAASNFDEGAKAGYFLKKRDGSVFLTDWWKGKGAVVDFTNPAAKEWWKRQVRKAVQAGADGFKNDDGEGTFVDDVVFDDGGDPRMTNRYSVLYNRAVRELIDSDLKGDGVLFMRSATQGSQNLSFVWAGDNGSDFSTENGLPGVVLAGLNAGMSGMALWASDLGGYVPDSPTPDPELFSRWTEFSAFSPIMEPFSINNWSPWDYGDRALKIFRDYSRLHMSLFPYRYAAAQEAARNGMPIIRSLVLFHPKDWQARQAIYEYYFGPDFLVAPVVTPGTQQHVYLPEGDWIDYWTGDKLRGPKNLLVDVPLDKIPVYVKSGAIIPKIPDDVMTLVPASELADRSVKTLDDRRIYEIYPGTPAAITDFEGRKITTGQSSSENTIEILGKAAAVTIIWRFAQPHQVIVNGVIQRLTPGKDGRSLTFVHRDRTLLEWE